MLITLILHLDELDERFCRAVQMISREYCFFANLITDFCRVFSNEVKRAIRLANDY